MAISRATLRTRVKERVSADLATPVINDLQDTAIDSWAQQGASEVMSLLDNPNLHYKELIVHEKSLTISSGSAALESDYFNPISLIVKSSYTDKDGATVNITGKNVKILDDAEEFHRFDETNFLLKIDGKKPVCLITDKIYFKPTTGLSNGKFNYVKNHPTIDSGTGTKFSEEGDNLLILYIVKRYYLFLEKPDLVTQVNAEIQGVVNGAQ